LFFEIEAALTPDSDKTARLQIFESASGGIFADVQGVSGLPNRKYDFAVISAVVPARELHIERARYHTEALPGAWTQSVQHVQPGGASQLEGDLYRGGPE
jgi:hypothetical protein